MCVCVPAGAPPTAKLSFPAALYPQHGSATSRPPRWLVRGCVPGGGPCSPRDLTDLSPLLTGLLKEEAYRRSCTTVDPDGSSLLTVRRALLPHLATRAGAGRGSAFSPIRHSSDVPTFGRRKTALSRRAPEGRTKAVICRDFMGMGACLAPASLRQRRIRGIC